MRTLFIHALAVLTLASCAERPHTITVHNDSSVAADGEIVEVAVADVPLLRDGKKIKLMLGDEEVPYQLTHDSLLIFPATTAAGDSAVYTIVEGTPAPVDTLVYGRLFPERKDDMAWENDRSAYRAYGPALQASGERAFGYDIWTKSVATPVLEKRMYDDIVNHISFHVDHGEGMDVYAVGPTLGGGTAALLDSVGNIVYPYCFTEHKILDAGPLRFSVELSYGDSTAESRVITLDRGSWLNCTTVRFDGKLPEGAQIASGIVVHRQNPEGYTLDAEHGFMAYADSTENAANGNGVIFCGVVAPDAAGFQYTPSPEPAGDAIGHILAPAPYTRGENYTYWWGSAWSKGGMPDMKAWEQTLADFRTRLDNPLRVTVE